MHDNVETKRLHACIIVIFPYTFDFSMFIEKRPFIIGACVGRILIGELRLVNAM